jgi:VWFA-related protein
MICRKTLLAWAALASYVSAQDTTLRSTVPLVEVPVSVTNKAGQFVYGLTANDFLLRDDGHPVPVRLDYPDVVTAPLAVVVAVQVTDISESALLKIKKVGSMIGQAVVGANGLAAVITYSDQVSVLQQLTADEDALSNSFRQLKSVPTRNGHMLDAVAKAIEILRTGPVGARPAIVMIGESKDRGSRANLTSILPDLQRSGATLYCIEYSAFLTQLTTKANEYKPPEGGGGWILDSITETVHAMKQDTGKILTASTGGRTLKFETKSKLENDLIRLGADIHSRYMLSFTAAATSEERFHHIIVEVKNRPDLTIRARPGYWSITQ